MKVKALKILLYRSKNFSRIYDVGEVFEMDDTSYYVRSQRGEVEAVDVTEEDVINVAEGLPPLDDDKPARKRK